MLEKLLGMTAGIGLGDLGAMAALTSIIVQVLKKIIPSKFPTQALVIIVSLVISILCCIMFYGIGLGAIGIGVLMGFVTAFVSMEGFDSLKNIWLRFNGGLSEVKEENDEEEDIGGEG